MYNIHLVNRYGDLGIASNNKSSNNFDERFGMFFFVFLDAL